MFRIEPYLFRDWANLNKTIRVVLACFYHKKKKNLTNKRQFERSTPSKNAFLRHNNSLN